NPLPATPLNSVVVYVRALPESLLGNDHESGIATHDNHSHNRVILSKCNSLYTRGVATHLANVALMEAKRETHPCCEHYVVRSRGDLYIDQLIAIFDLDGLDPVG